MRLWVTFAAMVLTLCALPLLHPIFVSSQWLPSTAWAAVIVTLSGLGVRAIRLPAPLVPLAQFLALLGYLIARYVPESAPLGFLPTPAAVEALLRGYNSGWFDIQVNPSPVEVSEGIALVTTIGVGILAVTIDFLAVSLGAAALTGMPVLAMLLLPLLVHHEGVSWIAFGIAAAGYLLLLAIDSAERLAAWGTPVADPAPEPAKASGRMGPAWLSRHVFAGTRVGAMAIALALLVPTLIPGLVDDAVFALASGARGAGHTVTTSHPLVSLRRGLTQLSDQRVLDYRTPVEEPEYLRVHVLDSFDGSSWTMSPVRAAFEYRVDDGPLPRPAGRAEDGGDEMATIEITLASGRPRVDFLPLPYPPRTLRITGEWFADPESLMVFSPQGDAGGLTYTVTTPKNEPSSAELADSAPATLISVDERFLELPSAIDDRVPTLARDITEGVETPHAKAVALQEWFTDGKFEYDLQPPAIPRGEDPLPYFLFESRIGYCEQFAASMAVLARSLGIPSRVAVGYTAGEQVGPDHWRVTSRDSHAWPELYFQGHGWLRFEPTPATSNGQGTASVPDYAGAAAAGSNIENDLNPGGDEPERPTDAPAAEPTASGGSDERRPDSAQGGAVSDGAGVNPVAAAALAALVIAVLLLLPALARMLVRQMRWLRAATDLARASAAWLELRDHAIDLSIPWDPAESPRAAARRLSDDYALDASATAALGRLMTAEESARYAPAPVAGASLHEDERIVRKALTRAHDHRDRLRATWLPRSVFLLLRKAPDGRASTH